MTRCAASSNCWRPATGPPCTRSVRGCVGSTPIRISSKGLDQRIVAARDEHKNDLERRFLEAAEREDIGDAMSLLRELDRYLDADEGERLSGVAQGVITRHRELLGERFRGAVNDRRWAEAAQAGEAIRRIRTGKKPARRCTPKSFSPHSAACAIPSTPG